MFYLRVVFAAFCFCGAVSLDCDGQAYRKFGHSDYRIIDTSGFWLYSVNKLVQGEKIARPQTVYYFSRSANDPVRELTLANLEEIFASDTGFRYRLEAQIRSDKDLIAYDKTLRMYKIKVLFSQSSH